MARTPESIEKAKVKAFLKELNVYQFWPVPSGYGRQGVDCYACIDHRFWGIEVKAPGEKPTTRQMQTLTEIWNCSGATAWGTADMIIKEIKKVHFVLRSDK